MATSKSRTMTPEHKQALADGRAQSRAVEHREHLALVRHLHRRCAVITVTGDHMAAQPLAGDNEFLAQLARPEQQDFCSRCHGEAYSFSVNSEMIREPQFSNSPLV